MSGLCRRHPVIMDTYGPDASQSVMLRRLLGATKMQLRSLEDAAILRPSRCLA